MLAFAVPSAIVVLAELVEIGRPHSGVVRVAGAAWTYATAYRFFFEHEVLFAKHAAAGGKAARWYLATLAAVAVLVVGLVVVFVGELLVKRESTGP
jgi:hypothetical protein